MYLSIKLLTWYQFDSGCKTNFNLYCSCHHIKQEYVVGFLVRLRLTKFKISQIWISFVTGTSVRGPWQMYAQQNYSFETECRHRHTYSPHRMCANDENAVYIVQGINYVGKEGGKNTSSELRYNAFATGYAITWGIHYAVFPPWSAF